MQRASWTPLTDCALARRPVHRRAARGLRRLVQGSGHHDARMTRTVPSAGNSAAPAERPWRRTPFRAHRGPHAAGSDLRNSPARICAAGGEIGPKSAIFGPIAAQ